MEKGGWVVPLDSLGVSQLF